MKRILLILTLVTIVSFLTFYYFIIDENSISREKISEIKIKEPLATIDIVNDYKKIKESLNYNKPGYGKSDYGNYDIDDIPKAHAMFLSAELLKYRHNNKKYNIQMAINSGNWLLNNPDINNNGTYGWGVPVSWDAFGDNSKNESNTEYTIATGIVINSLLDWIELSPETSPRERILEVIKKAIFPYLDSNIYSTSGLYNYSLKNEDRKYNCFNAAIYMAGQMQRFASFISDENLKSKIRNSVDIVMSATLKNKKIDENGGWYWTYSIEENNVPNDLAHAGYIIDGIFTYINNNGTLKELFEKESVLKHLSSFSNIDGTDWYFYPSFFGEKTISPRLYGIGMTLHLLSKYTNQVDKIEGLLNFTSKYKHNELFSRWQNEDIVITEYLIYLLYGMSSVESSLELKNIIYLHSDRNHIEKINKLYSEINLKENISFPLINFKNEKITFEFSMEKLFTTIKIGNKKLLFDKFKSIPIKVLENDNSYIILFRELLTNHLLVANINKELNTFTFQKIDHTKNSFLDFKNADILNNNLIVIAYESKKSQNTLFSYNIFKDFKIEEELKLPSVEDPAGKTYEVIPKIIILKDKKDKNKLHIIGGRLYCEYRDSKIIRKEINPDIKVITDSIINDNNQIYSIYKSVSNNFGIYNLTNNINYFESKNGDVLFGLEYYRESIQFRTLKSNNDLKELFLSDFLNNKGSGSLYLGTNNLEGWSAWAQVYYLNGLLSILELSKNDISFYEVFKDYLKPVKERLDLELYLLINQYNSEDSLKVRVFSVDRSLSTFAVQSSRFGMLLDRYLNLFANKNVDNIFNKLKIDIESLNEHMEVLQQGISPIVSEEWNNSNAYYLSWPKGNKFYFDGLPVPYNHQNEWASFLLQSSSDREKINIGKSIVGLFINNITNGNTTSNLPKDAIWPCWWGKAWDGYTENENISTNRPNYVGDKANGWISFRSIDSISMLKLFKLEKDEKENYIKDIRIFVENGYLYPAVSNELIIFNQLPFIKKEFNSNYLRFTSPWEFDNTVWAYLSFIKAVNK